MNRHFGRLCAPWALAATLLIAPLGAQAAAGDAAPVRGLIVRLKDAPAHERLQARPNADARERVQAVAEADREGLRWKRVVEEAGLKNVHTLRPVGRDQQVIRFDKPMSAAEAQALMQRLKARPDVDWVEVNTRERRLQSTPDDPHFTSGSQWWLGPVAGTNGNVLADRKRGVAGLQSAWLQPGGQGSSAVVVAVLDTGITNHPDLTGRVLTGYDFVSDIKFANDGDGRDADPSDPGDFVSSADLSDNHYAGCGLENSSWHGTVIAGMLAADTNNGAGVAALAWNGRVLPVRVAGKCGADVADIVDGMRWAAGLPVAGGVPTNPNPARIINISFGGSNACGSAYQTAINDLKAVGVIVVAAAGNEHALPTRPANCSGVVGVVALNRDGFKSNYSNFGSELTANGMAVAAGDDAGSGSRWSGLADEGVLTVGNSGTHGPQTAGYYYHYGTSFAAPMVSGVAGLMLGVNAGLTADQLIRGLRSSARPHVTSPKIGTCSWTNPGRCICTTNTCGAGILDAAQALLYAANPTTYVAPARPADVIDNADVTAAVALGADRDANPPQVVDPPSSGGGGGGGGGAMSVAWIVALATAAALLSGRRRRA